MLWATEASEIKNLGWGYAQEEKLQLLTKVQTPASLHTCSVR